MQTSPTDKQSENISFKSKEHKSFFMRLSPRVFLYPIVILVICYCMSRNKALQQNSAETEVTQSAPAVTLDPAKPTALVAADAPVFPQLIFYYDDTAVDTELVDKLHDKYHKICTVATVDLATAPQLKQKYSDAKPPFAVFSKPDGTCITIQDINAFDFYDLMLESQLQKPTPQTQTSESNTQKYLNP